MARPTLGPAYGNTDRSTPARLLGGIPESSSQAPIAGNELAAPALQVVQRIVDTFSAPGQGPTLGGPMQIPSPPGVARAQNPVVSPLPRPYTPPNPVTMESRVLESPTPPYVDNMGALAKSLSSFSTFFDALQRTVETRDKIADENAKAAGGALAMQAAQAGTFDSLQSLQKHLEKGKAQGLAGYDVLMQRFQAADPRALRYATIGIQDAYIKSNAATLKERVAQTKTLLDGRPVNSVPASDPAYQQLVTALMFPNGTMGILPEVYQANQQLLGAIYGSAASDQEKRFGGYKTQKAKEGLGAKRDSAAMTLVNGLLSPAQVAFDLTNGLDGFWSESGQTNEEYQKEKEGFAKEFVRSVLAAGQGNYSKSKLALSRVPEVIAQIRVGPVADGDKRPFLLQEIGGMAKLYEIMDDLRKEVVGQQNLQDSLDSRDAQEQVRIDIAAAFTPEVLADPAKIEATENILLARGRQLYAKDPNKALAYEEAVKKHTSGINTGYVQPVQEKNEINLWAEMAQNPNADFTQRIMQSQDSGQISFNAAKGFLANQASRNREDNRANYQILRGFQDDLKKRLELQYALPGSDGDQTFTPKEARELNQALGALYRAGDDLIRKNPGQDLTRQLGDLHSNALSKSLPQRQRQAPLGDSPEAVLRLLQSTSDSRGNPQQNVRLQRQAETGLVYSKAGLEKQLDTILSGKPLDSKAKDIIRRTGMKPSEFFIKQSANLGVPLTNEQKKSLQELDGGDLVSQTPTGSGGLAMVPTNRYLPIAQKLGLQFASTVLDAFVPPAAAAQPVIATASRGSGGINSTIGQRSSIINAASQLGIRPVDLAAVISLETGGTFAKDIKGGDGGNYQGLIQFGPSERKTYGYRSTMNFEQQVLGPVVRYLKARGVKPGHGAQEIYAAILTGNVANIAQGGLDWKDSNGTSVRKALPSLTKGGHYQNAVRFLRGN